MLKKIKHYAYHPTIKSLSIVTFGNILNAGLGFIAIILVSRNLGPEKFGVFSVIFGLFTLISKLGDLGGNATAIKYISLYKSKKDSKSEKQVAGFFLGITYLFILVTFIFIAPFYNQIAKLLNVSDYSFWVLVAIISASGLIMFNTYSVILQALEKFGDYIYNYTFTSIFKILGLVFLIYLSLFSLQNSLAIYFLAPTVGFLLMFYFLEFYLKYKIKPNLKKEALNKMTPFLYFMAISSIIGALSEQLGVFLSNTFINSYQAGLFSAANRLGMVFYLIAGSLGTVLIPRASRYTDINNIKQFAKKSFKLGLVGFISVLPVVIFPQFFIYITAGSKFLEAANVLRVISLTGAFAIVNSSFSSVFYALNKSQYYTYSSLITLIVEFSLAYIFLSIGFGIIGVALAKLISLILISSFTIYFYKLNINKDGK